MDASDDDIQATLQRIVTDQFKSGDLETLTLKNVRAAAEEELELPKDFLKTDGKWKGRSKEVVGTEVERLETEEEEDPDRASSPPVPSPAANAKKQAPQRTKSAARAPPKPSKPTGSGARGKKSQAKNLAATELSDDGDDVSDAEVSPKPKRKGKAVLKADPASNEEDSLPKKSATKKNVATAAKGRKRKSPEPKSGPEKRQKVSGGSDDEIKEKQEPPDHERSEDDGASSPLSIVDDAPSSRKPNPPKAKAVASPSTKETPSTTAPPEHKHDDSSSLSSLIDEAPARRKFKGSKATKAGAKPKPKPARDTKQRSRKSETGGTTGDTADDTIKLLQFRLLKCGIRKVWSRELAKFSSSSEKTAHLKGLLKDIGMDGRFSEEKARQIKAERELARELEDVREGDKAWGLDEGKGRPKRGAAKEGGWKRLNKGGAKSEDEESDSSADGEPGNGASEAPAKSKGEPDDDELHGNTQGGRRIARGLKTLAVFDDSESD